MVKVCGFNEGFERIRKENIEDCKNTNLSPPQNGATTQPPPTTNNPLRNPLLRLLFTLILCSLSYILGSTTTATTQSIHLQNPQHCDLKLNLSTQNHYLTPKKLDFEPHHLLQIAQQPLNDLTFFDPCPKNFTNYLPCHDPYREKLFSTSRFFHRERHCPQDESERLTCLVPRPKGYKTPFSWPKSRDFAWFNNVPSKKLTVTKKTQNWLRLEGDKFVFPGGGTSFPRGAKGYADVIKRVMPDLKSGKIRTALDIGCGVASFGASLMDYSIITMSVAPRDIHDAQVQFALERGLPAMIGILSAYRLPFPSRSFDMAHCSRCLVPWTAHDGLYLLEIDRVLRPGGYWVLSGPPIGWKTNYKGWQRPAKDLEKEQISFEDLAKRLCWKKIAENDSLIAVWRKPTNHMHCRKNSKTWETPKFCAVPDPDFGWYKNMEACITPLPDVKDVRDMSGGNIESWPKRLYTAPPRIKQGTIKGVTIKSFNEDNQRWQKIVSYYKIILETLFQGKYRNIMDMNADMGGFAAALNKHPVWVMNVVPKDSSRDTLGIVYERGLIGTYMNWCEAFSTYPRTYDLIHADNIFSMYIDRCDITDILLEMYRILRPEGVVIIRDHVDIIAKVKGVTDRMRWNGKILHTEKGPFDTEKILLVDNSEL